MKPIIGITVDCHQDPDDIRTRGKLELNWNYAQAVSDAGGIPVLIPPTADMAELVNLIDGWLIPGGADIDAREFGQENHPKVSLQDPARFEAESKLYAVANPSMPIFGICYGCQFLNVMRGGTLEQHVPDRVGGNHHTGGTLQTYPLQSSLLESIVNVPAMTGKSYHHQAVGKLGDALNAVAVHADGTIEAVEATDRPWVIGVQWHPERSLEDIPTQRLFANFIEASRNFRRSKFGVFEAD